MCKRRERDTQFDSHDAFDELHYNSKRETGRTKQLETNKKLQEDFSTFVQKQTYQQYIKQNVMMFPDTLILTGT